MSPRLRPLFLGGCPSSSPRGALAKGLRLAGLSWLVFVVCTLIAPAPALAWVESHVARDDVRVAVDPDGTARVEHRVLLLVSGGPLASLTIKGVDSDAEIESGAYVIPEAADKSGSLESAIEVSAKRVKAESAAGENGARTDIEATFAGRGIARGRFVVVVRYRTNLLASGALKADGASARLDWVGAEWDDGLDTTKATFVLPAAPKEPHTIDAEPTEEGEEPRGTFLSTLTKKGDGDTLEIVRPYASRGERVVWSLRVDPRAFPALASTGAARPRAMGTPPPAPRSPLTVVASPRETGFLLGSLALFVIVTSLVGAHALEVRERARRRDNEPRPLVALPPAVRAVLAGLSFVGGVALQLSEVSAVGGACAVAASVLFVWHLPAHARSGPRGPGIWLALRAHEAFLVAPRRRSLFDARTWPGALTLAAIMTAFGAAAYFIAPISLPLSILVLLDVGPLVALFLTGGDACNTPDPASDSIDLFRRVVRKVERARPGVRVVPRVRVPRGEKDADEMRVVFLPARPVRGLRAVELGAAFASGLGGNALLPEILLRFDESSPCEERVYAFEPYGRAQRGRRPDERVQTFVPKLPTVGVAADLVVALLDHTTAPPEVAANTRAAAKPATRRAPARRSATPVPSAVSETG